MGVSKPDFNLVQKSMKCFRLPTAMIVPTLHSSHSHRHHHRHWHNSQLNHDRKLPKNHNETLIKSSFPVAKDMTDLHAFCERVGYGVVVKGSQRGSVLCSSWSAVCSAISSMRPPHDCVNNNHSDIMDVWNNSKNNNPMTNSYTSTREDYESRMNKEHDNIDNHGILPHHHNDHSYHNKDTNNHENQQQCVFVQRTVMGTERCLAFAAVLGELTGCCLMSKLQVIFKK